VVRRPVDRPTSQKNHTAETRGQWPTVESAPQVSACEQRSGQLSLSAQGEEYDLDKHSFLRWSFSA